MVPRNSTRRCDKNRETSAKSRHRLTLVGLQSRFGKKPLKFQLVCPHNGTAALKGSNTPRRARNTGIGYHIEIISMTFEVLTYRTSDVWTTRLSIDIHIHLDKILLPNNNPPFRVVCLCVCARAPPRICRNNDVKLIRGGRAILFCVVFYGSTVHYLRGAIANRTRYCQ